MLSKYITSGIRLEIQAIERTKKSDDTERKRVYQSIVYDVLSEDRFEIYMPIEKTKLVVLPVDVEFDLYFYTSYGLYQCFAKVVDRYKTENKYILVFEITSNLRKYQRREFYRLSCALDMECRLLEEEEINAIEKQDKFITSGLPMKKSIIVDISGGGIRFVGDYLYELDSLIFCKYHLLIDGKDKEYTLVARIISVKAIEKKQGLFEYRAQYISIDTEEREEIIRFIFEEDRKIRRREKGF